jgi:hypothetical protein
MKLAIISSSIRCLRTAEQVSFIQLFNVQPTNRTIKAVALLKTESKLVRALLKARVTF